MSDRYQLIAYLATLVTLIVVFVAALATAAVEPALIGRLEAFGMGTITGGLIGVLRMPVRSGGAVEQVRQDDGVVLPADTPPGRPCA